MRRLTLRLPETLFHRLELLADNEGVSLNQYLVYSLTQNVARAYMVIPLSKEEIEKQQAKMDKLLASLEVTSDKEFDTILDEGEFDESGPGLEPEIIARIEAKIVAARHAPTK
jgi:hypothetical protein